MMELEITTRCNNCGCTITYHADDTPYNLQLNASYAKCVNCGERKGNIITGMEAT